jgi:alpha-beta hydrolase superfamily lysophospholipase
MKLSTLASTLILAITTSLVCVTSSAGQQPSQPTYQTVTFDSLDGVKVTADLYAGSSDENPFIVLCHQAGWSRGEYREIAPKLQQAGFNCLAIDQRSGKKDLYNKVANQTVLAATKAGKATEFTDAEQDIVAALRWARTKQAKGKVILWGSSYSAALSLRIAGERPDLVDGVMAFAPGEYFERFGKPATWIQSSAKKIQAPAFVTSAKNEFPRWEKIFNAIPGQQKAKFVPTTKGNHGSRALYKQFDDSDAYWTAVAKFLNNYADDSASAPK